MGPLAEKSEEHPKSLGQTAYRSAWKAKADTLPVAVPQSVIVEPIAIDIKPYAL